MRAVAWGPWLVVLSGCSGRTSPPDGAAVARYGFVSVAQIVNGPANSSSAFSNSPPLGSTVGSDGPCSLLNNSPTDGFSAGEIDITGTVVPIKLIASGAAPGVSYTPSSQPDPLFSDGASISIQAAGGPDLPAFAASLTAPTTLRGFTAPTKLSRSGYVASWTSGAGPSIRIDVAAYNSTVQGGGVTLHCIVDDTGAFTVPASSFALIPQDKDLAFLVVGRIAQVPLTAGSADVVISAASNVLSGPFALGP